MSFTVLNISNMSVKSSYISRISNEYGSISRDAESIDVEELRDLKDNANISESNLAWSLISKSALILLMGLLISVAFLPFGNNSFKSTLLKSLGSRRDINTALSFEVHTEHYGPLSQAVLKAYGFSAVIEPHRNLVLKPVNGRSGSSYTWSLTQLANVVDGDSATDTILIDEEEDFNFRVTTSARKHRLVLTETDPDGVVTTISSDTVVSMYVRREFRSLVASERTAYFDALDTIYHISYDEGVALYGEDYKSYDYLATKHNSKTWCYHGGMQYLTTHAGFTLDLDKIIQTINASLATPYWDFTIESYTYGAGEWYKSDIYSDDYFGPAKTSSADGYLITSGYFTEVPVLYGAGSYETTFDPAMNSFNAVTDPANQISGDYIMRSTEFCGLQGTQALPTCSDMMDCFTNYGESETNWEACIEKNVHANFHSINAGAQDCTEDWSTLLEEHPTWSSVLAFIGASTSNIWFKYGYGYGWTSCPSVCDRTESCPCTSTLDVDSMTDEEVYETLSSDFYPTMISSFYQGADVMEEVDGVYKWIGITDDDQATVHRFLLTHASNVGTIGQVATGAGPNDPLFFAFHAFFDRIYAGYRLSTSYVNGDVSIDWSTQGTCTGSYETDEIPFSGLFSEYDITYNVTGYYTNAQFKAAIDPSGSYINYVFDSFDTWGNCTFNMLNY